MPCNKKYNDLRIKNKWYEPTFFGFNFDYPVMICPFTKELEFLVDEKLINYVYENRFSPDVTKEQIKEAYENFNKDYTIARNYFI